MSAPVCSRRVSAGITPAPGTTSRLTVWWGRTDWLEVEVRGALRLHRDLCRAHHVAPDTVYAVARAMAGYADAATGRNCRPTNERMVTAARCSLSTIQRARRVLKGLGLVVEVTRGRSVLTLAERLAAWERGSSHRAIAAEFVLCSRRDRLPRLVDNRPPAVSPVDRDTPPVGQVVRTQAREISGLSSDGKPKRGSRSAALTTEERRETGPRPVDLRARRLAEAVRSRLAWLQGVPTARLVPLLTRFALADWTARDVDEAAADSRAARGWQRVPDNLTQPAAYLATLLREVDVAERPGAAEDQRRAEERAEHAYRLQLVHGAPCPHGQPAGHVPSPMRGLLACPACRAAAEPPGWA